MNDAFNIIIKYTTCNYIARFSTNLYGINTNKLI